MGLGRLARRAARWAARWVRRPFSSGAVILVYHRIAEIPGDPQLLSVSPERFASHLAAIRAAAGPVRLLDLVRSLDGGAAPARAVALTFDDGYADNLHAAKPLLERFEVPATVYVTTGQIDSPREFWWDELDRLLLRPEALPEALTLEIGGTTRRWEFRETGPRQRAYRELCAALRDLSASHREALLDRLAAWAGADRLARMTHRALSADEVRRLAEGGLIDVAPHTVTHPALSMLPAEDQRREIEESRRALE
ncbi:MAG: polysaccharide deacetylase family protein, partial [Candidatus Latescibacteria bacterium]|nr:polysaccharide deacetylase family protein [Candidatus Latescibacterota bacterium]